MEGGGYYWKSFYTESILVICQELFGQGFAMYFGKG